MNDKSNPTLEEMASEISEMEKQLLDMKKAYREKKYEGLKIAMAVSYTHLTLPTN